MYHSHLCGVGMFKRLYFCFVSEPFSTFSGYSNLQHLVFQFYFKFVSGYRLLCIMLDAELYLFFLFFKKRRFCKDHTE